MGNYYRIGSPVILGKPLVGVNVQNFGADPSPGTNDHSAFMEAIDAIAATGGLIYIPAGTYDIDDFILNADNITFMGDGWSSILRHRNRGSFDQGFIRIGYEGNANNIQFHNLCIDDQKLLADAGLGGNADCLDPKQGAKDILFNNLLVKNAIIDAIDVDGGERTTVMNCKIIDAEHQGILFSGSQSYHRAINNIIINCHGGARGSIAIKDNADTRCYVAGNVVIGGNRNYDILGSGTVFIGNQSYGGTVADNLEGIIEGHKDVYP